MKDKLLIIGASGHGKVAADIVRSCEYDDIQRISGITKALGVVSNAPREKLYEKAQTFDFEIVSLIHPTVTISSSPTVGKRNVAMPNVVEKDVLFVEDYVHTYPNVAFARDVKAGRFTHIGICSDVIQVIIIGRI